MGYNPSVRGANAKITSRATSTGYQNGLMSAMNAAAPVATNTAGNIVLVDPTSEVTCSAFVGLTQTTIVSGAVGQVVSDGRIENIPSNLGFSPGDAIYVGSTPGTLTNVKPDLAQMGWAEGMFVIFVGVVVVNEFNSALQDIQLSRILVGQL